MQRYRKPLLAAIIIVALIPVLLVTICFLIIGPYKKYVLPVNTSTKSSVGIVLGAGITHGGQPYKELQARLDSAAEAYHKGQVKQLILSGDNRFSYYDEPTGMFDYLAVKKGIPGYAMQRDYAGRSTYESCERAQKIFRVKKLIIFSAGSHLPRAIYLCRHFGIESYGIANNVEANNSTRRELLARVKAVYNTHIDGEPTVLGPAIPLDGPQ